MKDLQVFHYQGNEVRTLQREDGPWWVLVDVCRVLEIKNSRDVTNRLDADEKGVGQIDTLKGKQKMTIINEPGLYSVILRSDKPQAKDFKRWVTHEVLPSIRRTGEYKTPQKAMTDYQQMMAETRRHNVAVQKARLLNQIANQYDGTYKQVLQAHATKELTGEFLLPLPKMEERTFSAEEIGDALGISKQMVGILTNRHGLKTDRFGAWFNDKAKGHSKEVQSFRYYERVIPVLKSILEEKGTA